MCSTRTFDRSQPFRAMHPFQSPFRAMNLHARKAATLNASEDEAAAANLSEADTLRQTAEKKVEMLRGFYQHAATYAFVNAALIALNIITYNDVFWAIWPLLGWGINLAFHGIHTYSAWNAGASAWEERKVQEYMHRHLSAQARAELEHADRQNGPRLAAPTSDETEWSRLVRRIENLEAIVTTEEWDDAVGLDRASR